VYPHPYVAAELNRCRRADQLAAADNFRRARALLRQRGRHPLQMRLAAAASALVAGGVACSVRHPRSRRSDDLPAS